jgi:hypothetical protein
MTAWLEVIMPMRNPTGILLQSINSLAAQTRKNLAVLISDNHSTQGLEIIEEARRILQAAAIPIRIVRPSLELKRVEHWNWAHSEAQADWLKPLFVGDILFPAYVEKVFQRVTEKPEAKFIRCEMESRQEGATTMTTRIPFSEESLTPADVVRYYPRLGNWIGGPVNVAYHRLAWQISGGYMPQLPACADLQLYLTMILRHGLESIPTPLVAFQLHPQRFSHKIGSRNISGNTEQWLIFRQMQNQCREENLDLPSSAARYALWQQFLHGNWYPLKKSIKIRLQHWKLIAAGE